MGRRAHEPVVATSSNASCSPALPSVGRALPSTRAVYVVDEDWDLWLLDAAAALETPDDFIGGEQVARRISLGDQQDQTGGS